MVIDDLLNELKQEFGRAISKFPKFNNAHEGYAVLLEEVDELWDNIKLNQKTPNRLDMIRFEAIHVGAMAIRLIIDCCEGIE